MTISYRILEKGLYGGKNEKQIIDTSAVVVLSLSRMVLGWWSDHMAHSELWVIEFHCLEANAIIDSENNTSKHKVF